MMDGRLDDTGDWAKGISGGANPSTPPDLPHDPALGLHAAFLRSHDSRPEQPAVVCGDRSLSYADLKAAGDRLALRLAAAGLTRGDRVGLLAERGIEPIVAMLALARLGAAYVPLVPTYHESQIGFIAGDVGLAALIHAEGLAGLAATIASPDCPVLPITASADIAGQVDLSDLPEASGSDIAYVLYTSGSTGVPKGVEVRHCGISRIVHDQRIPLFQPGERVLHCCTLAGDISAGEIWGALLSGGTLVVVEDARASAEAIAATIERHHPRVATFYAGIFHLMIETRPEALGRLRIATAGGDTMSATHVAHLRALCPDLTICNMYGPTETTIFTHLHEVTEADLAAGELPLGLPIAGTDCFVLDEDLKEVPVGEPGQCTIGGPAVAAGYLNRPDLTAEKFIDDPRPGRSGKVYLTGDIVVQRPDGNLVFRGRVDRQVKLGGRRIELDEIETALRRLPLLADAAVALLKTPGRECRIAAFIKPADPAMAAEDLERRVRAALARELPDAMLPRVMQVRADLPLAGNGKVDRKRLVAEFEATQAAAPEGTPPRTPRPSLDQSFLAPVGDLETWIAEQWCQLIGLDRVGRDDRFFELGGTSMMVLRFLERLRAERGVSISVAGFFDGPTVRLLAAGAGSSPAQSLPQPAPRLPRATGHDRIAIVGLGGRFAGAPDVRSLWDMLLSGGSGRVEVSRDDLIAAGEDPALLDDPDYVPACYPLDEVDRFDAAFFGFTPREIELMDPQQRILLEVAWTALEDGGIDPRRGSDRVGVFAGVGRNAYMLNNLMSHPSLRRMAHDYSLMIGNERDFPAAHIAYRLGLHGPAMTVQTACSTSGVAIHMAAESLRRGECDIALAGGAKVLVPNRVGYLYTEGGPLSPDGYTRAFDAKAAGMVRGSGAAVIVMKRLDEALEAGDHVYAVLIGSSLNNDGDAKAGFTAPSASGQAEVIAGAYRAAGIDAGSVSLIEAHGTGTELGDPIEVEGLTRVFRQATDRQGFCALGSIKTNIGHLDAGATAAGVIKAALALERQVIPPSLNFERANPRIDWSGSPFFVAADSLPWQRGAAPRRAGVSSFGLGGTNAHLVFEEAPARPQTAPSEGPQLLVLSARTATALDRRGQDLATWLDRHPDANLADVAHTLRIGRHRFEHRAALVAATPAEAAAKLRGGAGRGLMRGGSATGAEAVAFMFPGGGAQYAGMALGLHDSNKVFREALDAAAAHLQKTAGWNLIELLRRDVPLEATAAALPALFAVEYAMAQVWLDWGIEPGAMIGHSVGEYAAACIAGVFSLEDALDIVLARGRLFETLAPGAMLSLPLSAAELAGRLPAALSVAAVNRPDSTVVSGPVAAIEAFAAQLSGEGIEGRRVHIDVAAHSAMVEPIQDAFGAAVRKARLNPPRLRFISNLSGDFIRDDEATDPDYWVRHLRGTVEFSAGLGRLYDDPNLCLIEIGPGQTLAGLARQHPARGPGNEVVATIRHPQESADDAAFLTAAVGRHWLAGGTLDEARFAPGRRRVPLPTYPFERQRLWIDAVPQTASGVPEIPATIAGEIAAPAPTTAEGPAPSRRELILGQLVGIVHQLSGIPVERIDPFATFLELGFDSLFLTQANAAFRKAFRVKLTTRQLMESLAVLDSLATHLDAEMPAGQIEPAAVPARDRAGAPGASAPATAAYGVAAEVRAEDSPSRPVQRGKATSLTAAQEAHIDALIAETNRRTPKAKSEVQAHRKVLADPRTVQGFRLRWKEMVYPVLSDRAQGSKIWDIDGNEYVDLVGGYGVTFLGHAPEIVTRALRDQIDRTLAIGPQTVLAGEVAQLVSDLTGMERVAFCNTGSEAVLAAVRTARTVTGKSKIVKFDGHYHGIFDEMQVRGSGKGSRLTALPSAPGITAEAIANTIIVKYGDPEAFEVIREQADDIAVVLVEPVRSRNPDYQPIAYLQELRRITRDLGLPLLFDEMITGFRSHPGGAQALFGVRADLATYGKVAGGGLPIGIVTGSATYMDALDGGMWQFGDNSAPPADMTWFAGTFVRHPLSLAAAKAVLTHLKAEGPQLQESLNARAAELARTLNAECQRLNAPIRVECFSSVLRITFTRHQDNADLLFFHLRNRGILTYEGRPIFLTVAHDDEDYRKVVTAFRESLGALVAVGLIEGRDPDARRRLPLTPAQQEIWISSQFGDDSSCSYNLCSSLELKGPLDPAALEAAIGDLAVRHEALRTVPEADGTHQVVMPHLKVPFALDDLAAETPGHRATRLEELRQREVRTPFDLIDGPLVRSRLLRLGPAHHLVLLTVHHVIADGWSCGVLMRDLGELYAARRDGRPAALPPAQQLSEFIAYLHQPDQQQSRQEARDYWLNLYADGLPQVDVPADRPRPKSRTYAALRTEMAVPAELTAALRRVAKAQGSTLFATLIGGFAAYLGRLTGAAETALGFAAAGQPLVGGGDLVGHCVNFLPLRIAADPDRGYGPLVKSIGGIVLDALEHQNYDFVTLVEELQPERNIDWAPLLTVGINLDPSARHMSFADLEVRQDSVGRAFEQLDLFVNFVETGDQLVLQCTFNKGLFDRDTVNRRMKEYLRLMAAGAADPEAPLADLDIIAPEDRARLLPASEASSDWRPLPAVFPRHRAAPAPEGRAGGALDHRGWGADRDVLCHARQPVRRLGGAVAERRGGPRRFRRPAAPPLDRLCRRGAGGAEGRSGLCADRTRHPEAALRVHRRRCPCPRADDPFRPCGRSRCRRGGGAADGCRAAAGRIRAPCPGRLGSRRRCLHDVYLRLDRTAEGRGRAASRRGAADLRQRFRPDRRDPDHRPDHRGRLRSERLRGLERAGRRRHAGVAGWRSVADGGRAEAHASGRRRHLADDLDSDLQRPHRRGTRGLRRHRRDHRRRRGDEPAPCPSRPCCAAGADAHQRLRPDRGRGDRHGLPAAARSAGQMQPRFRSARR